MTRSFGQGFSAPRVIQTPEGSYCPIDPEEYGGPDCDTKDLLNSASDALKALSALLKLSTTITDAKLRADFEKAVKDAQQKVIDGQNKMIDASNKINEASNGLATANNDINSLMSDLTSIQNSINLELSNISLISGAISSINTQLAGANDSLAQAQARFNDALGKPSSAFAGGSKEKRDTLRNLNNDMFNLNSTILDLQNTNANYFNDMNSAGERYNNLIPQANAVKDGVTNAYGVAQQYQDARNSASQQFNDGANGIRNGYNDFKGAGDAYRNAQENILMPMVEGATGAKGLSNALANIAEGQNFTAVSDVLNAGLESGLRNAGNATLNQFGGMWGSMLSTAGQSADQTIRQGGDLGDFFRNVAVNGANKLLGAQDFIRAGQGVQQAYQFTQAGDWQGAGMLASGITSNLVTGTGAVAGTALPFTPLAPLTPVVVATTPAIATGASSIVETMVQTAQTPISRPLTPGGTPLTVGGRGIYERPTAGQPSAGTVAIAGTLIGVSNTATSLVSGLLGGSSNLSNRASVEISNMANSGTRVIDWGSRLQPGSIELRPPTTIPVSIGGAVIGGP
jgi:hypothetical protein